MVWLFLLLQPLLRVFSFPKSKSKISGATWMKGSGKGLLPNRTTLRLRPPVLHPGRIFYPNFSYGSYRKGEYVAFNFRLDQKKVPVWCSKQFVRQSVQKYRDEHNGKWPNRTEKQQIQESMQEYLLSRAFPQPSASEVVWNPARRSMILGTAGNKMMEAFLEYFEKQFRLFPVPLYHAPWAFNVLPLTPAQKDVLDSLVSLKSTSAMNDGRFLGLEFLTWVWSTSSGWAARYRPEIR